MYLLNIFLYHEDVWKQYKNIYNVLIYTFSYVHIYMCILIKNSFEILNISYDHWERERERERDRCTDNLIIIITSTAAQIIL